MTTTATAAQLRNATAAFRAAQAGFVRHRALSTAQRLAELNKLKALILARRDHVIERVMQDVGKCRTDALIAEVLGAVDWIHWLEGHANRVLAPEKVATPITLLGKKSMLPLGRASCRERGCQYV